MLKRLIFWEYQRGSWQYDVIVGSILAFLFLAPRAWFGDQPRTPQVSVISIPSGEFMVDPDFWDKTPQQLRWGRLQEVLRARAHNNHLMLDHMKPFQDSDGELRFYIAFTRP